MSDIAPDAAVKVCKSPATVERAVRAAKSDLRIRPGRVYTEDHVRAHVFLCMPAGTWNGTCAGASRRCSSRTMTVSRSPPARDAGDESSSVIRLPGAGKERATIVTRRTGLHSRAFEFLEVNPDRTVPMNPAG